MPWMLEGKCVYKEVNGKKGELVKCHNTVDEAKAHLRALYANVANSIQEFSMFITKSSLNGEEMRWAAVNSDTSKDLYGERMTLGLYQRMLERIRLEQPPPEEFRSMVCSEFWCGGIPYVSIAHYSDGNGLAVPGETHEIFIDGNQLKAKGVLYNTPLGRAVWKSLKEDELNYKNQIDADRIRISIAFLDLAHRHGENGELFVRSSLKDVCPECQKGAENKIYEDGYLVHLALTRKPVNPRTIIEAEDMMAKKAITTRKDDALSIVQDESLVKEIEEATLTTKSDVLVEMSEPLVEEAKKDDKKDSPPADENDPNDPEEDMMEKESKKGKKNCSLTEEDLISIRSIMAELLPTSQTPIEVKSEVVEKSALDLATDALYNSINVALSMAGNVTFEQRLESINPSLQELGNAITELVRKSVGQPAPSPATNEQSMILEALSTLTAKMDTLSQEVALVKEKSLTPSTPVQNRVPVPRSIAPQAVVTQSQTQPTNPNSVRNLVRRSVGIQD